MFHAIDIYFDIRNSVFRWNKVLDWYQSIRSNMKWQEKLCSEANFKFHGINNRQGLVITLTCYKYQSLLLYKYGHTKLIIITIMNQSIHRLVNGLVLKIVLKLSSLKQFYVQLLIRNFLEWRHFDISSVRLFIALWFFRICSFSSRQRLQHRAPAL